MKDNQVPKGEKQGRGLMLTILIAIILIVSMGGYFVYVELIAKPVAEDRNDAKASNNKNSNHNNSNNNNDNDSNENKHYEKANFGVSVVIVEDDCVKLYKLSELAEGAVCEKTLKFESGNVDIQINSIKKDEYGHFYREIVINGKQIYINKNAYEEIARVEVFKDFIIITNETQEGQGVLLPIIIINQEGEIVLDLGKKKDIIGGTHDFVLEQATYTISDNKIIYEKYYELYGQPSCGNVDFARCIHVLGSKNQFLTIYEKNFNQYTEEAIYKKFEIEYLGNNKFSEAKMVSETKVKDKYTLEYFKEQ